MSQAIPTVGRTVLFAFKNKHGELVERPAVVVRVFPGEPFVNLQVFVDNTNDVGSDWPGANGVMWKTSAHPSETGEAQDHHWRWPPRS